MLHIFIEINEKKNRKRIKTKKTEKETEISRPDGFERKFILF